MELKEGTELHLDEIDEMVALPKLGVDADTLVFAGFGSGATMASQMHFVYSTVI